MIIQVEVDDDDDDLGGGSGNDGNDDGFNPSDLKLKAAKLAQAVSETSEADKETEEVLNEFNFLTGGGAADAVDSIKSAGSNTDEAKGGENNVKLRALIFIFLWYINPYS